MDVHYPLFLFHLQCKMKLTVRPLTMKQLDNQLHGTEQQITFRHEVLIGT